MKYRVKPSNEASSVDVDRQETFVIIFWSRQSVPSGRQELVRPTLSNPKPKMFTQAFSYPMLQKCDHLYQTSNLTRNFVPTLYLQIQDCQLSYKTSPLPVAIPNETSFHPSSPRFKQLEQSSYKLHSTTIFNNHFYV